MLLITRVDIDAIIWLQVPVGQLLAPGSVSGQWSTYSWKDGLSSWEGLLLLCRWSRHQKDKDNGQMEQLKDNKS